MKRLYIIARSWFFKLADLVTFGSGRSIIFQGIKIKVPYTIGHYYSCDYEKSNFDFINAINPGEGYFLDIGAHLGIYSAWLAKSKRNKVIAFEPTPSVYRTLQRIISLNKLEKKISAFQVAIAGFSGTTHFHLHHPVKPGLESLRLAEANSMENYDHGGPSFKEKIQVRCITIDDFRQKENCKVSFLKIDAEGTELSILRAASDTFTKDRPSGIISIHSFMYADKEAELDELFDLLHSYGMTAFYKAARIEKPEFLKLKGLDIFDIQFSPREPQPGF